MADKIYCGNGKVIDTKFGKMLKLSLTEEDIRTLQRNLDNGWVNINVGKKRSPQEGKSTHYLTIDTWKPTSGRHEAANGLGTTTIYDSREEDDDPDMPF